MPASGHTCAPLPTPLPPSPTHLQVVQLRGDLAVAQQSLSEAQDVVALLRGEVANLSGAVEAQQAQQGAVGQGAAAAGEPGRASSAQEVARLQRELATSRGLVQQLRAELAHASERWVGWMWFLRGVPSPPGCQPGPCGAAVGAGSGKGNSSCDVSVGAD